MQKPTVTRKCVLIGAPLLLLIANLTWWLLTPRERVYQGQPVSAWVEQLSITQFGQTNGVIEALLNIGPDCLPPLVDELQTKDSFLSKAWKKWWPKLPNGWRKRLPKPSSRVERRATAARTLGQIGPAARPVAPALVAALDDPEERVRTEAAEALRHIRLKTPKVITALAKRLADPAPQVQTMAAAALWDMAPESQAALPALIQLLHVPDLAYLAALSIQELGPSASNAIPTLIEVVNRGAAGQPPGQRFSALFGANGRPNGMDYGTHNRAMAAKALGRIGAASSDVLKTLQSALNYAATDESVLERPKAWVRQNAAQALGILRTNAISTMPALIEALDEKDLPCLQEIVRAHGAMGPHARPALPMLKRILSELQEPFATRTGIGKDRKWELFRLRGAVARAISQIDVEDEAALAALFEHADMDALARQHLSGLGSELSEFVPQLVRKLSATNGQPQTTTAELLWHIDRDNPAVVPVLKQVMQHTNTAFRASAAFWYWKATGDAGAAIKVLVAGLEEPPSNASQVFPQWLGDMGGAAKPAVPALRKALWHHDIYTRRNSAKALEKIDPSTLDFMKPRE